VTFRAAHLLSYVAKMLDLVARIVLSPLVAAALLVGATLVADACVSRSADTAHPGQATCEEVRDQCFADCKSACTERTYCDEDESPEHAACMSGCEESYTACIL
jgi:hypothetical protein